MARIRVSTAFGEFTFELLEREAPQVCAYFKALALEGELEGASVFRIVSDRNHALYDLPPIDVIQLGPKSWIESRSDQVPHESTHETGLSHLRWTVSAARIRLNELFGSFFICMRDEPELDFGGSRQPDGQGFAAFGRVDSGFDTLERIYQCAEPNDWLENEIAVESVTVIED